MDDIILGNCPCCGCDIKIVNSGPYYQTQCEGHPRSEICPFYLRFTQHFPPQDNIRFEERKINERGSYSLKSRKMKLPPELMHWKNRRVILALELKDSDDASLYHYIPLYQYSLLKVEAERFPCTHCARPFSHSINYFLSEMLTTKPSFTLIPHSYLLQSTIEKVAEELEIPAMPLLGDSARIYFKIGTWQYWIKILDALDLRSQAGLMANHLMKSLKGDKSDPYRLIEAQIQHNDLSED